MCSSPRLVCGDRPEGCVISCLNPPAAGHPCDSHSRVWYVSTSSCLSAPQPGFSGQQGKEQTRANAEDLFSRHGVRFGQPDSTPHPGTCSVGAELPQDFIRQDGGPTETLSEAPGACGCNRGNSSSWLLHMRPPQHWLSPEVG